MLPALICLTYSVAAMKSPGLAAEATIFSRWLFFDSKSPIDAIDAKAIEYVLFTCDIVPFQYVMAKAARAE